MDSAIVSGIDTEISLLGIASADIVMTGGGSGPHAASFKFSLRNVEMTCAAASGRGAAVALFSLKKEYAMMIFPDMPAGRPFLPGLGMPVGSVTAFAGQGAQACAALQAWGWMLCDGRSLACSQYPELFVVLGRAYGGTGDFFNIPDCQGCSLGGVGQGTDNDPGLPPRARLSFIIKFTCSAAAFEPPQAPAPVPQGAVAQPGEAPGG